MHDTYTVAFDTGLTHTFSKPEMGYMVLAYSLTVHKSQGCDYPYVIMPILEEHQFMLYKNLLYTGITRAKVNIELVGSVDLLKQSITVIRSTQRNTMLAKRLEYADEIFT